MDKSLVCRVLVPKKGQDKPSVSTGIAIKCGIVLMTKHALDGWDKKKPIQFQWDVNNHGKDKNLSFESDSDQTLFIGEIKDQLDIDVALIGTETPPSTPLRAWMLTITDHKNTPSFEIYGYANKIKKRKHYPATSFIGDLCSPNKNGELNLDLKTGIDPVEGWKGISGAPIYTGTVLYGIVIKLEKSHKKRLDGISVAKLLRENKDFRKVLGFSDNDQELNNNFKSSIAILNAQDKKLFKVINLSLKNNKDLNFETLQELCNYLIAIPITELLNILSQLQNSNQTLVGEIGELTASLLPLFADSGSAFHIKESIGDATAPIITIPYVTPISAEMLMAKADNRALEIKTYTQDRFIAEYGLIMPPESGEDLEQQINDITDDYYQYFGGDELHKSAGRRISHHLFDKMVSKSDLPDDGVSAEVKIALVQNELKYRQDDDEPTHYVILNEKHFGGKEETLVFTRLLKETYPQFVVLGFSSDEKLLLTEMGEIRKIKSIFAST